MLASDPPAAHWPHGGAISFVDVSVVYRPGLPPAVVSFSAELRARERAAVVGRTGAGKSTLVPPALPWAGPMECTMQRTMQHAMYPSRLRHAPCTAPCVPQVLALFRLTAYSGRILIDGRELQSVGLERVRKCVTIIPQEPVLHSGTVAHNLDPFESTARAEMLAALQRAGLPPEMLEQAVDKGGSNLSSGERQLLCFARALLQRRPVLVLDEATSNLDAVTDEKMQLLLRTELSELTLLTIAHRLQTIIDYEQARRTRRLIKRPTPDQPRPPQPIAVTRDITLCLPIPPQAGTRDGRGPAARGGCASAAAADAWLGAQRHGGGARRGCRSGSQPARRSRSRAEARTKGQGLVHGVAR